MRSAKRRSRWCRVWVALAGSPWLETRATTPRASCRRFGPGASPRTWHRTRRTAEARSIEGPQDTPGYELSQRFRKRVEEVFGWMKTVGLMRKTRHRGTDRVGWVFTFTAAAYNLVRIRNLLEAT